MNEAERRDASRTCTELILEVLEEFGKAEATAVVVLFTNEAGDIMIMRNVGNTVALGLCDYGRESILRAIFE